MHPVQEHINTLGIDYSIQRQTEFIYEYERKSFQPNVLQLNLDNINRLPTEKIGEFSGARIEPTPFCVLGRRPNHKTTGSRGYTAVKLMYLWVMLGGHGEHHNTTYTWHGHLIRRSITWCLGLIMSPAYEYTEPYVNQKILNTSLHLSILGGGSENKATQSTEHARTSLCHLCHTNCLILRWNISKGINKSLTAMYSHSHPCR